MSYRKVVLLTLFSSLIELAFPVAMAWTFPQTLSTSESDDYTNSVLTFSAGAGLTIVPKSK